MPDRSASSRAFFGSSRAGLVVVLFALAALFSPLFGPLVFFFGALLFGFAPLLVVLFALFPLFLSLFALVAVIAAVVVLAAAFFAPTALAERVGQHLAHLFRGGSVVAGARDGGRGRDAGDHEHAQRQAAPGGGRHGHHVVLEVTGLAFAQLRAGAIGAEEEAVFSDHHAGGQARVPRHEPQLAVAQDVHLPVLAVEIVVVGLPGRGGVAQAEHYAYAGQKRKGETHGVHIAGE